MESSLGVGAAAQTWKGCWRTDELLLLCCARAVLVLCSCCAVLPRDAGKMRWREFATPIPHDGVYSVLREVAENTMGVFGAKMGLTDNASVNIVPHPSGGKGRALALTGKLLPMLLPTLRLHRTSRGFISPNARRF